MTFDLMTRRLLMRRIQSFGIGGLALTWFTAHVMFGNVPKREVIFRVFFTKSSDTISYLRGQVT